MKDGIDIDSLRDSILENKVPFGIGAGVLLLILIFMFSTLAVVGGMERRVKAKGAELERFEELKGEYLALKRVLKPLEARVGRAASASPGTQVEGIGAAIGIKGKITSFKPLPQGKGSGDGPFIERGVEVKVDGLTVNEILNLLYSIETTRNLLVVKEFKMKSRYKNSALHDITMKIYEVTKRGATLQSASQPAGRGGVRR